MGQHQGTRKAALLNLCRSDDSVGPIVAAECSAGSLAPNWLLFKPHWGVWETGTCEHFNFEPQGADAQWSPSLLVQSNPQTWPIFLPFNLSHSSVGFGGRSHRPSFRLACKEDAVYPQGLVCMGRDCS